MGVYKRVPDGDASVEVTYHIPLFTAKPPFADTLTLWRHPARAISFLGRNSFETRRFREKTKDTKNAGSKGFLSLLRALRFFAVRTLLLGLI